VKLFKSLLVLTVVTNLSLLAEDDELDRELEELQKEMQGISNSQSDRDLDRRERAIELEKREREYQLQQRERELKLQKQELELQNTTTAKSTPKKYKSPKKKGSGGGFYIGARYGIGAIENTELKVENDSGYEYDATYEDKLDLTMSGFKIGFGKFTQTRFEIYYNQFAFDEAKPEDEVLWRNDKDKRVEAGINFIITGSGETFNPYFSFGGGYVQHQFDSYKTYEGDDYIEGYGANIGLGLYISIIDNFEIGVGYEYKLHFLEEELGDEVCTTSYDYYSGSYVENCETQKTGTIKYGDQIGLITADLIIRF
jgi:hypothetical protein